ncbi:hypothetical protein PYW07_016984 [Mythimna separata]|uniref:Prostaglandin reductase 1 n=1 Tax=Mythimna separata TaxID=271217 RepID=A0AAD7YVI8_MYTSE|nr:hypothetical protein PYW07_016984 [Mythimna separata]
MVKARKYIVTKRFEGTPKKSDFKIVTSNLPKLKDQEILVKAEWISVDPYMRPFTFTYDLPYDQFGYQVGIVQESKNNNYPVGTRVVSHNGWCDYCIMKPDLVIRSYQHGIPHKVAYKLPDELEGLSASLGVGAVGFTGAAAYFGFYEVCKPSLFGRIVVTTAAGAVGSIVGQIAKIKGWVVIGFTGSQAKVNWLKNELGFDFAFNYKTEDVAKVLKDAAPYGIDCLFDNVGGELSYTIMKHIKIQGCVVICGCISAQNQSQANKAFRPHVIQRIILTRQLRVEGFLAFQWINRWPVAFAELAKWIKSGKIKTREHITFGFDNIVKAFLGMLNGENIGKAMVWVYNK